MWERCKSMSRRTISSDPGIIQRLMKHFDMSEGHVITSREKKSFYLAQKALNCRDEGKVMDVFTKLDLSPVTSSQRHEVKHRATAFEIIQKGYQEDAVDSRRRQSAFSGY